MLLRRCVESLVPVFADGCELDLQGDGQIVRIVAGLDPAAAERRERAPVELAEGEHPIVAVLRGGPARLLDLADPADEPLFGPAELPSSARALGMTTALLAPVVVSGRVVGSLAFGRGPSGRRFEAGDIGTAVDLARRLSLAWHNALLLAERASILASLHDGLIVSDADGKVLEVNERWTELTGFPAEVAVGATMPYPWWPDADAEARAHIGEVAEHALGGERIEERVVLKRADGSLFPALVSVAPVVDRASGHRRALVASVKDLTSWEAARDDLIAIQRVTSRLAAAGDVATVVSGTLTEVLERTRADGVFMLRLADDGQQLELGGSAGALAAAVVDRGAFPIDRTAPSNVAVRDDETVVVSSAEELRQRFPDVVPETHTFAVASIVTTPVRRRGEAVGAISVWSTRPGAFGATDVAFLEAVATQFGEALPRAEGYELEHRASQALQRRLLSDVPLLHPRATIVTRYQPASTDVAVGGDWYDVVPLGRDRLAVIVGDVVGSGVEAAAVMGQLRSALKGIALVTPEPVAVLQTLDQVAASTAGAPAATVCYALVDLAAGEVRFSRAGHPPPLVVPADGEAAHFLTGFADLPLGLRHGGRREASAAFGADDVLLLYTDGLIERRDAGLDERFEVLRTVAARARRHPLDDFVDDVLAGCVGDQRRRDDLAVLAVRDEPPGTNRFRVLVPARGQELAPLRRSLQAWLVEHGVDELAAGDAVLATSEAATNAVEHAYRDSNGGGELLSVTATSDGDGVVIEVRDTGRWKARPSETSRGRGMSILRRLGSLDVRTGPTGTTVRFRSSLRPDRTRAR